MIVCFIEACYESFDSVKGDSVKVDLCDKRLYDTLLVKDGPGM